MKHINSSLLLLTWFLLLAAGCGADQAPEQNDPVAAEATGDVAVVIRMEGKTYQLSKIDQRPDIAVFEEGEIRFFLMKTDHPVQLNFNLTRSDILESGSAVYVLPAYKHGGEMIDLNFYNRSRDSESMQKRILFTSGTIEVQELTRNSLRMTFKGMGKPLMGQDEFPVEGSVNVTF